MKFAFPFVIIFLTIFASQVDAYGLGFNYHESAIAVPLVNFYEKDFIEYYLSLLTNCNIDGIRRLYADAYMAFNEEGDSLNKKRMVDSQVGFCKSPLASTNFTLIEARTPREGVFFLRIKAENTLFKTGPVRYSQTMTVNDGRIVFEVQCANAEAYTRAIRGESNIDGVKVQS